MPLRASPLAAAAAASSGSVTPSKAHRWRLTFATGLSLLLLVVVGSTLLLRLSMAGSGTAAEYQAGGGPPGTAALNAPPGSFAHRLRSSWKVLTSLAQKQSSGSGGWSTNDHGAAAAVARIAEPGAAVSAAAAASLAAPLLAVPRPQRKITKAPVTPSLRGDAAARHAAEVAAAAAVTPPAVLAEFSPSVADSAAPSTVEELTSGALAFVRDALRGPTGAAVPAHPTPSQALRLALDHLAGRPAPAAGAPLSPAPAAPAFSSVPMVVPPPPGPDSPLHGLVVATRFWATSTAQLGALQRFLESVLPYAERVLVALNVEQDSADTLGFLAGLDLPPSRVQVLAVTPWLGVSTALNALALSAAQMNASRVLLQNVHVSLTEAQLRALVHEFDSRPDQLVVGPVLDGHVFEETKSAPASSSSSSPSGSGDDDVLREEEESEPLSSFATDDATSHEINGHNAPWNAAALWHVPTLLQTGFLTVADGFPRGIHQYGQEEVPTINLLQALAAGAKAHRYARRGAAAGGAHHAHAAVSNGNGSGNGAPSSSGAASGAAGAADLHRGRVTLLHVGDVSWAHSFPSALARKEWHERKMHNKLARAAHHMSVLGAGLHPGRVEHRIARVHHDAPLTMQLPRVHTQIVISDTSIQHEQATVAPVPERAVASDAPALSAVAASTADHDAASLAESAAGSASSASAVAGSIAVVGGSDASDSSDASAVPAPIPIPTRRVKRNALQGLRARGAAASAAAAAGDAHAADEPMHVKVKRHIPIGRR